MDPIQSPTRPTRVQPLTGQQVESSNVTANLFLGVPRRSWMREPVPSPTGQALSPATMRRDPLPAASTAKTPSTASIRTPSASGRGRGRPRGDYRASSLLRAVPVPAEESSSTSPQGFAASSHVSAHEVCPPHQPNPPQPLAHDSYPSPSPASAPIRADESLSDKIVQIPHQPPAGALPSPAPSEGSVQSPIASGVANIRYGTSNTTSYALDREAIQAEGPSQQPLSTDRSNAISRIEGVVATVQLPQETPLEISSPRISGSSTVGTAAVAPGGSPAVQHSPTVPQPPIMTAGYWKRAQDVLEDLNMRRRQGSVVLSTALEIPRLSLLQKACQYRDAYYLVLHQLYCLHSMCLGLVDKIPGFGPAQAGGLEILKQLLLSNDRMSDGFTSWCIDFPLPLNFLREGNPSQYDTILLHLSTSMASVAEKWTWLQYLVDSHRRPPLVLELAELFRISSKTIFETAFISMSRRIYGDRQSILEPQLRVLFENDWNVFKAWDTRQPLLAEQSSFTVLQNTYKTLHGTVQPPSCQPVPDTSGVPSSVGPARQGYDGASSHPGDQVTASGQLAAETLTQARSNAGGSGSHRGFYQPQSVSSAQAAPAAQLVHPSSANLQMQTYSHPAHYAAHPHSGSPAQLLTVMIFDPRLGYHVPRNGFAGAASAAGMSSILSPMSAPGVMHHPILGPHGTPPSHNGIVPSQVNRTVSGRTPTWGSSSVSDPPSHHTGGVLHASHHTRPSIGVAQGHAATQNPAVPPARTIQTPQAPQPPTPVRYTPLLPPGDLNPPTGPYADAIRSALHQVQLRSPVAKLFRQESNAGEQSGEEVELFLYFNQLVGSPALVGPAHSTYTWRFRLPSEGAERLPRRVSRKEGERSIRVLRDGCQTYRLRCVRLQGPAQTIDWHLWSTAETIWPSVLYIFVNGTEHFVRRKVQHGKDLPLDVTDSLREGENNIEVNLLRSPAEQKDGWFLFGLEIMNIADLNHVKDLVKPLPASKSREIIQKRLMSTAASSSDNDDDDNDLAVVSDHLTIDLIDPFMARVFDIPARSATCKHLECFDLDTFLMTRACKSGKVSMKDDWRCPICNLDARPQCLLIDEFLLGVRRELECQKRLDGARAINVRKDGDWELKTDTLSDLASVSASASATAGTTAKVPSKRKRSDDGSPVSAGQPDPIMRNNSSTSSQTTAGSGHRPPPRPVVIELD